MRTTSRPPPPLTSIKRETTHQQYQHHPQQSPQIPLRSSSIKISRPSPFLRKKPSFGDKTGKTSTTTVAPSRNPFALPARNLLSIDRRKKAPAAAAAAATTPQGDDDAHHKAKTRPSGSSVRSRIPSSSSSGGKVGRTADKTERSTVPASLQPSGQAAAEGSSSSAPPSAPEPSALTNPTEQSSSTDLPQPQPPPPSSTSAVIDIDETTEDAPALDDEEAYDDNNEYNNQDEYDGIGGPDADADTQDTAEVTTEEEGEILGSDDDDDNEDQEEDDDDEEEREGDEQEEQDDEPFESPLKRAAEMAAAKASASSSSSSGGLFSFKLKPTVTASSAESSFKLPFTSPFSSGSSNAPKPFSASSSAVASGNQFGGSSSSGIFSGGGSLSTSSSMVAAQQQQLDRKGAQISSSSVKENLQPPLQTESSKKEAAKPDPPKASQFSFGGSSFSSSAPSFGVSNPFDLGSSSSSKTTSSFGISGSAAAPLKSSSALFSTTSSKSSSSALPVSSSSTVPSLPTTLPRRVATPPTTTSTAMSSLPSTSKAVGVITQKPRQQQQQPSSTKDSPNPLLLSLYPDTAEAQELFSKRSTTVEERYRILEARDKFIRSRVPKTKVNVEFATKLIGTCPDMCPEKERYMRQFQRQLVSYETLAGPDSVVDHQKAIKAYSRSSADQEEPLPHELRPGSTLDLTMHYLLRFIVPLGDNPDENLGDWYNFLWDRTRSIRKDITQQQIVDLTAVSLYEKCARFHIHCSSRLCELDVYSFDPKLNDENLMKCLQSLEHLYEDLRRRQVNCPSEPEFRAYQIMMNLNEGDALYNAQQLPSWILNSDQVQTALKLHHSIYTKNFVAFFKMVREVPYMISCILHRYFFQVRSLALRCFMKAHCTLPKYETAMPMPVFQRMLGYGPDQCLSFSFLCEAHGIHCDVDDGRVILKRKMFYLPESPSIYREAYLVDSKLGTSVAEAVNGGPLPNIDFANHKPHCSFDETGQLIPGRIVGGSSTGSAGISSFPDFVPPVISTSSSSGRFQFQQPKPVSSFPAPAASTSTQQPPPFSFGVPLGSFQRRKEVPASAPPAYNKPRRDIEAACQVVTSNLIEESVRNDVAEVSQVQLDEARRLQERDQRRRLMVQVACRVAAEVVEQTISQEVDKLIRTSAAAKMRQLNAVEIISRSSAATLTEECVSLNVRLSARNELQRAEEFQTRLLTTLRQIFQRIRARFVLSKWTRFTRSKKREREREEEKRREQLWNFPAINSYSHSTSQVFQAFCGRSKAQPSLDKAAFLNSPTSPTMSIDFNLRPTKRKSDGDAVAADHRRGGGPKKLPRLSSGTNIMTSTSSGFHHHTQDQLNNMWEFPPSNPYARTNRQVFQAFCGSSSSLMANLPVSPKMITFGRATSHDTPTPSSSFKIHKPIVPISMTRVTQEIRSKANESISDLLQNIQGFVTQLKEEKEKSCANLDQYVKGIEMMDKTCSELISSPGFNMQTDNDEESMMDDDDDEEDWLNNSANQQQRPNFLSGVFLEEDDLLSSIRNFVREVKVEKRAVAWSTDTFLNNIELEDGVL